jgi:hypothetical protein
VTFSKSQKGRYGRESQRSLKKPRVIFKKWTLMNIEPLESGDQINFILEQNQRHLKGPVGPTLGYVFFEQNFI